jgi:hypothetical protein
MLSRNQKIQQQNNALVLCVRLREAGKLNADGCSYSDTLKSFRKAAPDGFTPAEVRIAYDLCCILDTE